MCFPPFLGMRCQENGERAAFFLVPLPPLLPGLLLKGPLLGGPQATPQPALPSSRPFLSFWLGLLDRGVSPLLPRSIQAPSPHPPSVSPEFTLQGVSSMSEPPLRWPHRCPRHGLAGGSPGDQDCLLL